MQSSGIGVIYLALGEQHKDECRKSVYYLKQTNPTIPVSVFTDSFDRILAELGVEQQFIRVADKSPFKVKVEILRDSPYLKTLFLDTDTYAVQDISELFHALDTNDFLIARAPHVDFDATPPIFLGYYNPNPSLLNTGVFAYRASNALEQMLLDWRTAIIAEDHLIKAGTYCDQHYFIRQIAPKLLSSFYKLSCQILDNCIYNLRPWAVVPFYQANSLAKTKIIHGRADHINSLFARNGLDIKLEALIEQLWGIPAYSVKGIAQKA